MSYPKGGDGNLSIALQKELDCRMVEKSYFLKTIPMKDIDIKCYSVTCKGVTTHLTNFNGITTNVITSKRMKQSRKDFNNWIKELRNSGYTIIDCNAKRGEFLNIATGKTDKLYGI